MANWITHTLLADELLRQGLPLDEKGFVIGSIAPDCNLENADWTSFTPPREVTHWMTGSNKQTADFEGFYQTHLAGRHFTDPQEYSFLFGYYVHLLTDVLYQRFIRDPDRLVNCFARLKAQDVLTEQLASLPENFDTLKTVFGKKRIFRDIAVLENNAVFDAPDCSYNRILQKTVSFPHYLPLFPQGAIERKISRMVYAVKNQLPENDLLFFSKEEYLSFLSLAFAESFHQLEHKLS